MENTATAPRLTTRWVGDRPEQIDDQLAIEEPLEIRMQYGPAHARISKVISVTMRTPGDDTHLALGFLFTEGILTSTDQVASVDQEFWSPNSILVQLEPHALPNMPEQDKHFYTSSSCGVCGKASIEAIRTVSKYDSGSDTFSISVDMLYGLQAQLQQQQTLFDATGGIHASALYDRHGRLSWIGEDVGRHNALDKVIGRAFQERTLPLYHHILLLSGRASFELVQKAYMAGISVVVALGAPSSLAVETARSFGITLIGFLKQDRFNLYTAPHRIIVKG
ncbi:formate dehydrogenase accessory sulfurtransferase FdhD [Dyadobacter tibetensis]|uniref:formate dehydrogenase accessory sulfurtransferase FdhD n=1 Tax=Dyadobacter tibetensis TaxID=1211851 RepID=UPI0004700972|nr:formate dehydrogenase accessory sulfurtransferase FdhD [Dyadobacter tibetensis]